MWRPFDGWRLNFFVYVGANIRLPTVVSPTLQHPTRIQKQQFVAFLANTPAHAAPVHIGALLHGRLHSSRLRPRLTRTSIMRKHHRRDDWLGDGPNRSGLTNWLHSFRVYRRDWRGKTGDVTHLAPDSVEVMVRLGLTALDGTATLHPAGKPTQF